MIEEEGGNEVEDNPPFLVESSSSEDEGKDQDPEVIESSDDELLETVTKMRITRKTKPEDTIYGKMQSLLEKVKKTVSSRTGREECKAVKQGAGPKIDKKIDERAVSEEDEDDERSRLADSEDEKK